ncbi:MAG: hypothetical protein KF812_09545 [Fimbriimonadaceae bacterium]|nr:hypothetical protein [Fimbriimonadaceae bacterium]
MEPRKSMIPPEDALPENSEDPRCDAEGEHERIAPSQEGNSVLDDFQGNEEVSQDLQEPEQTDNSLFV